MTGSKLGGVIVMNERGKRERSRHGGLGDSAGPRHQRGAAHFTGGSLGERQRQAIPVLHAGPFAVDGGDRPERIGATSKNTDRLIATSAIARSRRIESPQVQMRTNLAQVTRIQNTAAQSDETDSMDGWRKSKPATLSRRR